MNLFSKRDAPEKKKSSRLWRWGWKISLLALVGGGHSAVRRIAARLDRTRPHLADWTPTIGSILGVTVRRADGVNLLY